MKTYSISTLAQQFNVSTRTIRYYEELGLLQPERKDTRTRVFLKKDQTRLRLILRGKKYGFSLEEIKEMIELFDQDRTGKKQLERTVEYGKNKIAEVTERIEELTQLRNEMEGLLVDFETRLNKFSKGESE